MQLFEPILVKSSTDVSGELKKVCDLYALEGHMVSFDILHISTFYRGEKKKDFGLLTEKQQEDILCNEENYNKSDFEIKQAYDIQIRGLKKFDLTPFVELHLDNECYELTLELKEGLEVRDDEIFLRELYAQITRQKILQRIIVRPFGKDGVKQEIQSLKDLLTSYSINGKLESTRYLVITKAGKFMPSVAANFNFSLQEEWNNSHAQTIDFALFAANSGDLVGLSLRAQEGESGRNLRGEYVHVKRLEDVQSETKIKFKDDEFRIEEKDNIAEYYALKDGYVSFGDNALKILTDFHFPEVSLRKNGSLLGGDKKGFTIEVACADSSQDAIGANIVLEAADIKIYGSVAENVRIVGDKVEINGQTHQSTNIYANELSVDILKGSAIGDKIHINRLETGSIEGEEVFVEQANGGEIRARDITIGELHSHTKIIFSHHAHIKNMNGGENVFIFSSYASLRAKEEAQYINASMSSNIQMMNTILNVLSKDLSLVRKTKPVVEKIKVIMEENKKNNKPNEPNIINSMAQYVVLLRRTKYLKERLLRFQDESKKINARLQEIDSQIKDANLTIENPWYGENEIVYENSANETKDSIFINDGEDVNISLDLQEHKIKKVAR